MSAETVTSDDEIIADVVRQARAAPPGRRAIDILERLKADYPEVDEGRIKTCMGKAAEMLLKQHDR